MANEMYKLSVGGVDYPIYSEGVKLIGMSSASSLTDGFYPIVFSSNIGNATSGSSSYQKLYTDTAVGTIGYNPNTNVFWADSVKTSKLMIPTTSGGTTYGVGSNGQVLKSNGTTVYWASDSNTTYSAGTGLTLDSSTKKFAAKLTSTTAATYDSVTASNVSGRQYPVVVDKSGYLSVNVPWTDANTWRGISDIYTSTDSASSDTAFSRKGANTMYTALLNGHAGTADKLVSSGTAISLGSATAPVYFKNGVPTACTAYADASVKSATSATTAGTADKLSTSTKGSATNPVYFKDGVPVACTYELNKTVPSNAVFTDTKNTAGATNSASKLYLIGATEQSANPQTYSNSKIFIKDGVLTVDSITTKGLKSPNNDNNMYTMIKPHQNALAYGRFSAGAFKDETGITVSGNANGVLWVGTHVPEAPNTSEIGYGHMLGFVGGSGALYHKVVVNGSTSASWRKIAYTSSDITGNAASADKLKTKRKLWG
jgi:hypothetical protein